jgi:hypothetical protein
VRHTFNQRVLIPSLVLLLVFGAQAAGQEEKDPHRPACTSVRCKKIQSFLKARYCGESFAGNGPEEGCDLRKPKGRSKDVTVVADYKCHWDEKTGERRCEQHGQPSAQLRKVLLAELRRLGLRAKPGDDELAFNVLSAKSPRWIVAKASYGRRAGLDLTKCGVIVAIDSNSKAHVLREERLHKTNVDVPEGTWWSVLDLADADGDGQIDVILEGGAYENHWLEVDSLQNGKFKKIFSGLGYYL